MSTTQLSFYSNSSKVSFSYSFHNTWPVITTYKLYEWAREAPICLDSFFVSQIIGH